MARKLSNYYSEKMQGCIELVNLKKKKVTSADILKVSKEVKCPAAALRNGWRTFQETGGRTVDYRIKTAAGTIKMEPTIRCSNVSRPVSAKEAGSIIREYMTCELNSRQLANLHNISVAQFYSWIRELNISGKLFGTVVLDPTEYAKLNVCDVIWLRKKPNTRRKSIASLTYCERKAYERVADVLMNYLP